MGRPSALRFPYVLAVALVAAAVGDAVVETLANAGAFGAHRAFDDNHRSVIPALVAGAAMLLEAVVLRCLALRRAKRLARDARASTCARAPAAGTLAVLPYAFPLQLAALYVMESAERLVTASSLPHGLVWLGAPVMASLTIHALVCSCAAFVLARLVRALSQSLASLVDTALAFVWLAPGADAAAAYCRRSARPALLRTSAAALRLFRDRAPPRPAFG